MMVLLLYACVAAPPGASMAPEVAAMDAFVHATHGATQRLSPYGPRLGHALFDLAEGKGSAEAVRAAGAEAQAEVDAQRAALAAYVGPTSPALEGYRSALDDYLAAQKRALTALVDEGIPLAEGEGPLAARGAALEALARRSVHEEEAGAARVQAAIDALYEGF